jgi:uncharacterized repeat protein (TIGR03803 family)
MRYNTPRVFVFVRFVVVLIVVTTNATQAQTFKVIHNFTGGDGRADGASPEAGLTMDAAGNLYGTTLFGGSGPCNSGGFSGCGTVFQLKPVKSSWVFNTIYNFVGGNDGAGPWDRVVIGPDGVLYGTTTQGGGQGNCQYYGYSFCGTVFKLKSPATACGSVVCPWDETVLYSFSGTTDGNLPQAKVTFDQAGDLYGTTYFGGVAGDGVVFKLTPSNGTWTQSVVHNFGSGATDGQNPSTGLTLDGAGNLYGTTNFGSDYGYGTVFELTRSGSGWAEDLLYGFQNGNDGGGSTAGLIFDNAGNLYSASAYGGANGGGTVFQLTPSDGGWMFNLLDSLSGTGCGQGKVACGPYEGLVMDAAGNLYGTTQGNSSVGDYGTVFKLTHGASSWTYAPLHVFTGGTDGSRPRSSVVFDTQGNIYGTATQGGTGSCTRGCGVVWEITP